MTLPLEFPYAWQERSPRLMQGVLFVPRYYFDHAEFEFPHWSDSALFGNENAVKIEYCSGNGEWIIQQAESLPEINWVAVEQRFDRLKLIWSKAQKRGLKNLFCICGEAFTFSKYYLKPNSVEGAYINFPDPWPKERHAKHRLMQSSFLEMLSYIFKPHAELLFVTDDRPYLEQTIALLEACPDFQACLPSPFYVTSFPYYGKSYFDSLWRQKGRDIFYTQWKKQCLCP